MFQLPPHALVLGGMIGYFIGSIPFAYLFTKWRTGKDLRYEGTGNIGTANAFDVTQDKRTALLTLAADILKGLLPVLAFEIAGRIAHDAESEVLFALIPALILGHCYPIWLRFRGGRGLATSAGAIVLVNPAMVATWCILYLLARRIKDDVHFGSIVATGGAMAAILLVPLSFIDRTTLSIANIPPSAIHELAISVAVALLIILSRHIEPFIALVKR
jgi:glycerol-3-phosphate acyltransferase PlsY